VSARTAFEADRRERQCLENVLIGDHGLSAPEAKICADAVDVAIANGSGCCQTLCQYLKKRRKDGHL
jgi:hypothetical protein